MGISVSICLIVGHWGHKLLAPFIGENDACEVVRGQRIFLRDRRGDKFASFVDRGAFLMLLVVACCSSWSSTSRDRVLAVSCVDRFDAITDARNE